MTPSERASAAEQIEAILAQRKNNGAVWKPLPGPQTEALNSEADELFYGGAAGGGKQLSIHEVILTGRGWITLADIRVGDKVLDQSGQWCNVVAVRPIETDRPCFAVAFDDGGSIIADAAHPWATVTLHDGGNAERVRTTQQIAETLDYGHVIIGGRRGIERRLITACRPVPSVPVRCIGVDSPSHLYLVGENLIPTHNTDLLIGAALTQHRRSIIFRREFKQLMAIRDRTREIYSPYGRYNGQDYAWRLKYDGVDKTVYLGGVQNTGDESKFQGHNHDLKCVGRGTPVLLADGSYKPIEGIAVGDMVATLEGPRRVARLIPARVDQAVKVKALTRRGEVLAEQVQSWTHELLLSTGKWASYASYGEVSASQLISPSGLAGGHDAAEPGQSAKQTARFRRLYRLGSWLGLGAGAATYPRLRGHQGTPFSNGVGHSCSYHSGPCSPTVWNSFRKFVEPKLSRFRAFCGHLAERFPDRRQGGGLLQLGRDGLGLRALCVCEVQEVPETGSAGSLNRPLATAQRPSAYALQGPQRLFRRLSGLGFFHGFGDYAGRYAPCTSLFANSQGHCSFGFHPYDGPLRRSYRRCFESGGDRSCLLRLADVGLPSPSCFANDDREQTPRRSHSRCRYFHPYRKDIRQSLLDTQAFRFSYSVCEPCDLFDIEVEDANHYISKGGFINKNCFDEVTSFTLQQYEFLIGWNRTAVTGQRARVIAAGNPPTNAAGYWVIQRWAPWVDKRHPNPAKPGELRWFARLPDQHGRMIDTEVDGPAPIHLHGKDPIIPRSRTFIRALLKDNPYYEASGYRAVLQAMPEPLRSQMLEGDFGAGQEDDANQVIPTAWVLAAQARWSPMPPCPIDTIGADIARGGNAQTVFSPRHGWWFGEQTTIPGTSTPDGWTALQHLLNVIPSGSDPAIHIDIIGVGASVYDLATGPGQGLRAVAMDARHMSGARDRSGKLGFSNKRAEWWWKFREALDPLLGEDLALPPDQELLADLTAPRWEVTARGILIEGKDDIYDRIGRSTDKGDSMVMAFAHPTPVRSGLIL